MILPTTLHTYEPHSTCDIYLSTYDGYYHGTYHSPRPHTRSDVGEKTGLYLVRRCITSMQLRSQRTMYLDRTVRLPPSCIHEHQLMIRSCTQCAQIECIPKSSNSKGKSINPGVIAGPVVAALIILGVAALWWLRRKRVYISRLQFDPEG